MKKLYTLLTFIITLTISAQSPQGFNYQATVRNNAGALMVNQNVTFKFNVIKDTPTSVPVFSETHYVPTDDLGAVNLVIGKGTPTMGTFATIDWATGTYYLGIELNTGNGFKAMGTTQLLSVPYALYSENAGSATIPNLANVLAKNNSANNTKITNLGDPVNTQDAATKAYVDALESKLTNLQNIINNNISLAVTDIDGNTYQTVKIGKKIQTTENLNVSRYRNGDIIPEVTDPTQWANLTTGAWCYYNNDPTNGSIYGKLYNWYAVNDPRGLAPEGWHIPSLDESYELVAPIKGGRRLASSTTSELFRNIGISGYWWSSTSYDIDLDPSTPNDRVYIVSFSASNNGVPFQYSIISSTLQHGFSVRCIKD
jgi:uncharacterized protein (TIGR02145 family)